MADDVGTDGVRAQFVETQLVAREWWREDETRLLPGERGKNTVFVVEYADGCRSSVTRAEAWSAG